MTGTSAVYVIWYGTWDDNAANTAVQFILTDFLSNVGGSPYFQINAMYPNGIGGAPSGALLYGGSVVDRYSHGLELTADDIAGIAQNQIETNGLPQDPSGIYVVLASADVSSNSTGFCPTFSTSATRNVHGAWIAVPLGIRRQSKSLPYGGGAAVLFGCNSVIDS
jgi:hypothetical protein